MRRWDGLVDRYLEEYKARGRAAATTFLYSGEQFDPRIGQQYLRARYYDPGTVTTTALVDKTSSLWRVYQRRFDSHGNVPKGKAGGDSDAALLAVPAVWRGLRQEFRRSGIA